MRLFSLLSIFLILHLSCGNNPQITYNSNEINADTIENKVDRINIELSFTFDSVSFLYFPIGKLQSDKKGLDLRKTMRLSYSNENYLWFYQNKNSVDCQLENLLISKKGSNAYYLLTSQNILIYSINYLFEIDTLHHKKILIYKVVDEDTNKDGEIDNTDIQRLYKSDVDGKNFTQISPQNQLIIDWNTANETGIIFFRTLEDINKDGVFDKIDRVNLFSYNLLQEDSAKLIFNDLIYKDLTKQAN